MRNQAASSEHRFYGCASWITRSLTSNARINTDVAVSFAVVAKILNVLSKLLGTSPSSNVAKSYVESTLLSKQSVIMRHNDIMRL